MKTVVPALIFSWLILDGHSWQHTAEESRKPFGQVVLARESIELLGL